MKHININLRWEWGGAPLGLMVDMQPACVWLLGIVWVKFLKQGTKISILSESLQGGKVSLLKHGQILSV